MIRRLWCKLWGHAWRLEWIGSPCSSRRPHYCSKSLYDCARCGATEKSLKVVEHFADT